MGKGAREFKRWKACLRKRAYESEAAAYQKGQESYRCQYCGKWHRSGALGKFVAQLHRTESKI